MKELMFFIFFNILKNEPSHPNAYEMQFNDNTLNMYKIENNSLHQLITVCIQTC